MTSITFPYLEERLKIFGRIYRPVVRVARALIEDVPPLLGRIDVFNNLDVFVRVEEKEVVFKKNGKET